MFKVGDLVRTSHSNPMFNNHVGRIVEDKSAQHGFHPVFAVQIEGIGRVKTYHRNGTIDFSAVYLRLEVDTPFNRDLRAYITKELQ